MSEMKATSHVEVMSSELFTSCRQFDQMSVQASQYGDELRVVKGEVAEVNRLIGRLQTEIEAVKAQVSDRVDVLCPRFLTSEAQTTRLFLLLVYTSEAAWRTSLLSRRSAVKWP